MKKMTGTGAADGDKEGNDVDDGDDAPRTGACMENVRAKDDHRKCHRRDLSGGYGYSTH